ncbi:MAG: MaoC family dehydratase [Bacteroidia bacterium]|nr:MaoC family dehydratase [Bacteroidia bacterium]
MITVNQEYRHTFSFTQQDVEKFAAVSGDNNPIHLDPAYAAKTVFKKPIIHGFLGASVFSKVFGMLFPGEGTVYMSQNMRFMAPMFTDQPYEAVFKVLEVNAEKHRAKIETTVLDNEGKIIISGDAMVMNPNRI